MKTLGYVVLILIVLSFFLFSLVIFNVFNTRIHKTEFTSQLEDNWLRVNNACALLPKRCDNAKQLNDYADYQWKTLRELRFKVAPKFHDDASQFMNAVMAPTLALFDDLSEGVGAGGHEPKIQLNNIVEKAKSLRSQMDSFKRDHPELPDLVQGSDLSVTDLESRLKQIYVPKSEVPKIVIVQSYPSWVTTGEQRVAWQTMESVAQEYFAQRKFLAKVLNWEYGKQDWSYFGRIDVQNILSDGLETRLRLLEKVQTIKQIDGNVTSLGDDLETMLDMSIRGLRELINRQDYAAFKRYNNQNDQISAKIKRNFNIR